MGQDNNKKAPAGKRRSDKGGDAPDRDVGTALRSVYEETVQEQVPDEFLDLLGKLN